MLKITESGHLFIEPGINADDLLDIIIMSGYQEEFCIARSFSSKFIAELMRGGFLVMSVNVKISENEEEIVLLPKHHLIRTVLFFENLHIGKTIKRLMKRAAPEYELRINHDYDKIVERCAACHGEDWLTKPLLKSINSIRRNSTAPVQPYSFGLYRNSVLCAGEFGIKAGGVYTSYSGYHEEDSSGRIQMILTAQYLQQNDFAFWDLGMPLDYKYTLGAHDVDIKEFTALFRAGRSI
jgi:Leu/Phe-tRNA-protein transferase